jgi:hypothetical protein
VVADVENSFEASMVKAKPVMDVAAAGLTPRSPVMMEVAPDCEYLSCIKGKPAKSLAVGALKSISAPSWIWRPAPAYVPTAIVGA